MNPTDWYGMIDKIFAKIPSLQKCTSHSVRKSAAIWAGRCLASTSAARNCGRWKSVDVLMKYMAQGIDQRRGKDNSHKAEPQECVWLFKDPTYGTASGQDLL